MATVHQAIGTTELPEVILLIANKNFLLAQKINKHFKAVIDNSVKLQQALFFRPDLAPVTICPKFHNKPPNLIALTVLRNQLLEDLIIVFNRFNIGTQSTM